MGNQNPIGEKVMKASWEGLGRGVIGLGWKLDNRPNIKKFERGPQKVSVSRIRGNKWKVEYFVRGKLVDSMGVSEEEFAKVLAVEACVLRGFYPRF